jgi:hypothetical protein
MPDVRQAQAVPRIVLLDRQPLFPLAGPKVFPLVHPLEYPRTQAQARGPHRP